jgi:hypothetical protein
VILTEPQAFAFAFGSDADRIALEVCVQIGLASTRDEGADALASWALDKADADPALEVFSRSVDILAWAATVALKGAA